MMSERFEHALHRALVAGVPPARDVEEVGECPQLLVLVDGCLFGLWGGAGSGHGTRFSMYFQPLPRVALPAPVVAASRFTGTALIVDDEPQVAKVTGRLLAALGFDCVVVNDGAQALARFTERPGSYAVVVCDVLMPGLDGPATVATLRAVRADLPVLFISGYTPDLGLSPRDGGMTGFLAKPFDHRRLAAALAHLVAPAVQPAGP